MPGSFAKQFNFNNEISFLELTSPSIFHHVGGVYIKDKGPSPIKDRFIKDPITVHESGKYLEIQPGLKRSLFIPYLPKQKLIYFVFRKKFKTDDSIQFISDNIVIEKLWGENITAQVRPFNRKHGYKDLVTQEDIEIYLKGDTIYFNDIAVFKKDHDWKICLPNLMENT